MSLQGPSNRYVWKSRYRRPRQGQGKSLLGEEGGGQRNGRRKVHNRGEGIARLF